MTSTNPGNKFTPLELISRLTSTIWLFKQSHPNYEHQLIEDERAGRKQQRVLFDHDEPVQEDLTPGDDDYNYDDDDGGDDDDSVQEDLTPGGNLFEGL